MIVPRTMMFTLVLALFALVSARPNELAEKEALPEKKDTPEAKALEDRDEVESFDLAVENNSSSCICYKVLQVALLSNQFTYPSGIENDMLFIPDVLSTYRY